MPLNWKAATGGIAAAVAALLALAAAVEAQTAKTESVLGRPRPDFDPLGIELDEILNRVGFLDKKTVEEKRSPLSSFVVRPITEIELRGESNIFRTEDNPKTDEIAYLRPSIAIASDWNNHAVNFRIGADIARHVHYSKEDFENVRLGVGGRLDASDTLAMDFDTRYEKLQEARGVPDDVGAAFSPVITHILGLSGGARYQADLLLLHLKGRFDHLSYKDGDPATTFLRDRDESEVALRTGWELDPGTIVFVEPSANARVYRNPIDAAGIRQGSQGYRVLAGISWDVSGVTFIEAAAGWLRQTYEDPGFAPTQGPSVDLKAIWNPTEVMTVTANIQRRVDESAAIDPLTGRPLATSGVLVTQGGLGLDYELLENLIFSSKLDYANQKFEGTQRTDNTVSGTVAFDYRIGRKWYARLGYDAVHRSSNLAGASFEDQFISLRLGERL